MNNSVSRGDSGNKGRGQGSRGSAKRRVAGYRVDGKPRLRPGPRPRNPDVSPYAPDYEGAAQSASAKRRMYPEVRLSLTPALVTAYKAELVGEPQCVGHLFKSIEGSIGASLARDLRNYRALLDKAKVELSGRDTLRGWVDMGALDKGQKVGLEPCFIDHILQLARNRAVEAVLRGELWLPFSFPDNDAPPAGTPRQTAIKSLYRTALYSPSYARLAATKADIKKYGRSDFVLYQGALTSGRAHPHVHHFLSPDSIRQGQMWPLPYARYNDDEHDDWINPLGAIVRQVLDEQGIALFDPTRPLNFQPR